MQAPGHAGAEVSMLLWIKPHNNMLTLAHACLMLAYQPADNPLEDLGDAFEPEEFIHTFVSPNYEVSTDDETGATVTEEVKEEVTKVKEEVKEEDTEVKEEVKEEDAGKCRPISVIYYSDLFKKKILALGHPSGNEMNVESSVNSRKRRSPEVCIRRSERLRKLPRINYKL